MTPEEVRRRSELLEAIGMALDSGDIVRLEGAYVVPDIALLAAHANGQATELQGALFRQQPDGRTVWLIIGEGAWPWSSSGGQG